MDDRPAQLDAPAITEVVFLITITLAGTLGNALVIGVVLSKRLMRTRTNWFLVVLAVNHVGMAMCCTPFRLASILTLEAGRFGNATCQLSGFMNVFWSSSTIFTLVVVSLHKYFSVVKPLKRIVTRRRAVFMVLLVWLGAFACAIGPALGWGNIQFLNVVSGACPHRAPTDTFPTTVYVIFLVIVAFGVPVITMAILYWRVFRAVKSHCQRIRETAIIDVRGVLTQKHITTTLFIIWIASVLCWVPFLVYAVTMITTEFEATQFSRPLLRAAFVCGFSQCVLNPVLLGLRNPRFRRGFKDIALCKWREKASTSSAAFNGFPARATRSQSVDYLAEKRCSVWFLSTQQSLLSLEAEQPQRRLKLRWIETNL